MKIPIEYSKRKHSLILFVFRIGVDLRQARSRRKCMMMLGTSQYKTENHSINEYFDIYGLERNISEDLATCYDSQEQFLETLRAILNIQSDKVEFECKQSVTVKQEEIFYEGEPIHKLKKRSIDLYRSHTIRR